MLYSNVTNLKLGSSTYFFLRFSFLVYIHNVPDIRFEDG